MDDKVLSILEIVFVVVLVGFVFILTVDAIIANADADRKCVDAGYAEAISHSDTFYCVQYGLEPKILRLADDE